MPTRPTDPTDVLDELGRLAPDRLDLADPDWPAARELLLTRIGRQPDHAPTSSERRQLSEGRRRAWIPLTAAAAALAVSGAVYGFHAWSPTSTPAAQPPPSATGSAPATDLAAITTTLADAAASQGDQTWARGAAWHQRVRQFAYGDPDPVTIDRYVSRDLTQRWERITRPGSTPGPLVSDKTTADDSGIRLTRADLDGQPTQTPDLLAWLGDHERDAATPAFLAARGVLLAYPPTSGGQRAALLRAFGAMPGVTAGTTHTTDGRDGIVLRTRHASADYELVFDPRTAAVLESRRLARTSDGADIVTTVVSQEVGPAPSDR